MTDPGLSARFSQCAISSDEEFSLMLNTLAGQALVDGDFDAADWLLVAADWHWPPGKGTLAARETLLVAALTMQAAGSCGCQACKCCAACSCWCCCAPGAGR